MLYAFCSKAKHKGTSFTWDVHFDININSDNNILKDVNNFVSTVGVEYVIINCFSNYYYYNDFEDDDSDDNNNNNTNNNSTKVYHNSNGINSNNDCNDNNGDITDLILENYVICAFIMSLN